MLEGPNLYFPRAAIKLTLDLTGVRRSRGQSAPFAAGSACRGRARGSGSGFRQRFAARASVGWSGTSPARPGRRGSAVRVRPTNDVHRIVVAYPWRSRLRAQALGRAVAEVLDALPDPALDQA